MTFRQQIRRTWAAGLLAVALSAGLLLWIAGLGSLAGDMAPPVAFAAWLLLTAGLAVIAFGGIMRPAHRWIWHRVSRKSTLALRGQTLHGRITTGPFAGFWRLWLHIDRTGKDKDHV